MVTEVLVRVINSAALYGDVTRAVQERTTMLMVACNILYDRVPKSPAELRAERIVRMQMLSSAEFERDWYCVRERNNLIVDWLYIHVFMM